MDALMYAPADVADGKPGRRQTQGGPPGEDLTTASIKVWPSRWAKFAEIVGYKERSAIIRAWIDDVIEGRISPPSVASADEVGDAVPSTREEQLIQLLDFMRGMDDSEFGALKDAARAAVKRAKKRDRES